MRVGRSVGAGGRRPLRGRNRERSGGGPSDRVSGNVADSEKGGYERTAKLPEFTDVQSSFTVPTAVCTSTNTNASIWVGLGTGVSRSTLFQPLAVNCTIRRPPVSRLVGGIPLEFRAELRRSGLPGQHLRAEVSVQGTTADLLLRVTAPDATPRWSEDTPVATAGGARSAECIAERPMVDGTLAALTDFGVVHVSGCDATADIKGKPETASVPNSPRIDRAGTRAKAFTMVGAGGTPIVAVSTTKTPATVTSRPPGSARTEPGRCPGCGVSGRSNRITSSEGRGPGMPGTRGLRAATPAGTAGCAAQLATR